MKLTYVYLFNQLSDTAYNHKFTAEMNTQTGLQNIKYKYVILLF